MSWLRRQNTGVSNRSFGRFIARCVRAETGSVAVLFSFALPVILLVAGGTVDFVAVAKQRNLLQSAADASALSAARGLSLVTANQDHVGAVASDMVRSYLNPQGRAASKYSVTTEVRQNPREVEVRIVQQSETFFGDVFGLAEDRVTVSATATIVGQPHICVLALSGSDASTIRLEQESRITGTNCAIYSNSSASNSIDAKHRTVAQATFICSSGGAKGDPTSFRPQPLLDCPMLDDPLAHRSEPYVGACTETKLRIETDTVLAPGVYCGGIEIRKGAKVEISDGIYVIKDGELQVSDTAQLIGTNVSFYFVGDKAGMFLKRETKISLSAPESGPMAGILMFSSRHNKRQKYWIRSNNARTLIGTIYLPNGQLWVETQSPVADQSAYTAIVAHSVHLRGEPNLVLNTDYDQTLIPGATGMENEDEPVRLSR